MRLLENSLGPRGPAFASALLLSLAIVTICALLPAGNALHGKATGSAFDPSSLTVSLRPKAEKPPRPPIIALPGGGQAPSLSASPSGMDRRTQAIAAPWLLLRPAVPLATPRADATPQQKPLRAAFPARAPPSA